MLSRMIMEAASRAVVLERQYELQQESLCHTGFLSSEKGSFRTSFCYYEPVGTSIIALIQVETAPLPLLRHRINKKGFQFSKSLSSTLQVKHCNPLSSAYMG